MFTLTFRTIQLKIIIRNASNVVISGVLHVKLHLKYDTLYFLNQKHLHKKYAVDAISHDQFGVLVLS